MPAEFAGARRRRPAGQHRVRDESYVGTVRRIAVIGCGGAGKTTLARGLGTLLGLAVVHIDAHYWRDVGGRRVECAPEQ